MQRREEEGGGMEQRYLWLSVIPPLPSPPSLPVFLQFYGACLLFLLPSSLLPLFLLGLVVSFLSLLLHFFPFYFRFLVYHLPPSLCNCPVHKRGNEGKGRVMILVPSCNSLLLSLPFDALFFSLRHFPPPPLPLTIPLPLSPFHPLFILHVSLPEKEEEERGEKRGKEGMRVMTLVPSCNSLFPPLRHSSSTSSVSPPLRLLIMIQNGWDA